ncbi:putative dehydrogenase [Curtobacterium sp. PhB142]|uniref:Gfo/Idh/MocA family protein n=1 Tax=unclassified Curtobacterium TaxID=257496 RepID=UPI00105396BE|nr:MULTISPECIES: Gfo/Idh/MocA family oxidoreductase [unclassified Curtobacterium]TCL87382.1 putative dehydrogenase [Curtobacterium sp. PhB142]TCM05269.1 putative dehydrogenase [Curtobacterium sp. PhB134]TDW43277.1 putative dehydrogenase [Curtobacterium sp. PhB42]TDW54296.1 putative dehydrogenase [Curtobacterium sp. PhB190]
MNEPVLRVGVVGVGVISQQYFEHFPALPGLSLVAVADLDVDRAQAVGAAQGVRGTSVDELLAADDVDVVLNLTIPAAHADVATRALAAGKHVYGEKPLAMSTAEAEPVLEAARAAGLRVGSAPDTVLGTGIQTARAALDDGLIGTPVGAAVAWSAPGHELWHPAPAFYYQPGGGPLLDMGPYYLTSLVTFFGSVVRVSGSATRSTRERTVATGPNAGTSIPVDIDTHVVAILEHENGVVSTVTVSFEVWATRAPLFEVYGTAGTLGVPDPNRFSDPVSIATADDREWRELPVSAGYADAGRGYGLADLAHAITTDRPHRASGDLAFHVLEVMEAVSAAARDHAVVDVHSRVDRPATVPAGSAPGSW